MSGTAPDPRDETRRSDAPSQVDGTGDLGARGGPVRGWLVALIVLVVVLGLALVAVLLVWAPWRTVEPVPVPVPELSSTSVAPAPPPAPSPPPDATGTPVAVPGADAVFDATTAATLFTTPADVEGLVPGAASGVRRGVEPGSRAWGLPTGSVIEPASCTVAVTTVQNPPSYHDATSWVNDDVTIEQDVVLLLDGAAARAAFRALVTTVDGCPRYAQVGPDGDGPSWTAEPALEGQGVFPAIVHDVRKRVGGDTFEQTSGHVLVGNAIMTWTATARTADDREQARAVLGEPADLAGMVERRALAAVRGLSSP